MNTKTPNLLALLLQEFFGEYLPNLRGMSSHTITSYRDSIVLLLRFIASLKDKGVILLGIKDLDVQGIHSFLIYLEQQRNNSISTRNNRLSAIHTFFKFVAYRHPDRLAHAQLILGVPFKRTSSRIIDYLDYEEFQGVLATIDRSNIAGRRDYALLATMFNTGARVQEILDLRGCDLQLTKPFQLHLMGKGRKQRCCPIWAQTAQILDNLCKEMRIALSSETRVFLNCRAQPLTRFGVRYIFNKCLHRAQPTIPSLRFKRLHPHSIRHSTAIALLKSGVDLSTISQWLGHSSIESTNRYATIDLDMKRKAIESVEPVSTIENHNVPWRGEHTILEWLEAL